MIVVICNHDDDADLIGDIAYEPDTNDLRSART